VSYENTRKFPLGLGGVVLFQLVLPLVWLAFTCLVTPSTHAEPLGGMTLSGFVGLWVFVLGESVACLVGVVLTIMLVIRGWKER
jgi:hypothetical protein